MNNKFDIIVIGAGISGSSFAHFCQKTGLKTLVLEKNSYAGGNLHTHHYPQEDFWIELGAHTCYNSYTNLLDIIDDLQLHEDIVARKKVPFRMLVNNQIKSFPSQINSLELLWNLPKILRVKKTNRSIKNFYSSILGEKNYAKVFRPAFSAVLSQSPDNFPAEILFKKRASRRPEVKRSFTCTNGIQQLVNALKNSQNIDYHLGAAVSEISYQNHLFHCQTGSAETFSAKYLLLATPVNIATGLIKTSFPHVARILGVIASQQLETVGVIVKKDDCSLPLVAGIIPQENSFFSIVSRDTVEHSSLRGFTFHFKPETKLTESEKITRITSLLKIKEERLVDIVSTSSSLPALNLDHFKFIGKIDEALKSSPLFISGNYFNGLAIEDCLTRSTVEFKRLRDVIL